jgi:hypothetical protein
VAVVALLVVGFVGVALAKPWSGIPSRPASSASPSGVTPGSSEVAESLGSSGLAGGASVPRADPITLPAPAAATAAWSGIRWRQLAPDDPLNLIRSVVPWRGGFVAVGFDPTDPTAPTPIWTSSDGAAWQPLPVGTATTFWPGVQVVAIADIPTGLVALTSPGGGCDGYELCQWFGPPVTAWTSSDGRHWTPRAAPALGTASTWRGATLAGGPAGLVAVSMGTHAETASSADGTDWRASPMGTLPTDVAVGVLQGTPTGYVLAGTTATRQRTAPAGPTDGSGAPGGPGTLWSADGRHWLAGSVTPGDRGRQAPVVDDPSLRTLAAGRDGLVARVISAADPTVDRWWRSTDGRLWQSIPGFEATGSSGAVTLVGDGQRIVVVRGGPDGGVWVSTDGLGWSELNAEGTPPTGQPSRVVLLPGGVLVSTGSTAWYGTASTREAAP